MMTQSEFDQFVRSSQEILKTRQESLWARFHLDQCERFDWYQAPREIVFTQAGIPKVVATIQFVGSYSMKSRSWLWSWANPSVDFKLCSEMFELRQFGQSHGIAKLIEPQWEADEVDGWEMTSVAANVLNAEGAYRSEEDNGFTFMILKEVRWV